MTIQTDTSKPGRKAYVSGLKTITFWSRMEKTQQINILKLKAIYVALLAFTKETKNATVQLHIDNISALTYLLKIGGTQNLQIIKIYKEIWIYLLSRNISITGGVPAHKIFRKICRKVVISKKSTVKKVHFLKTRYLQSGNGYHATELVKESDVSFPSIFRKDEC